ncbi:hypothetical protein B0H13DRAFT_1900911 [Mycena leptocephala]|nr:hypothetical protein B0H13DRAFT_1900911 [Mycena leptocephala]
MQHAEFGYKCRRLCGRFKVMLAIVADARSKAGLNSSRTFATAIILWTITYSEIVRMKQRPGLRHGRWYTMSGKSAKFPFPPINPRSMPTLIPNRGTLSNSSMGALK